MLKLSEIFNAQSKYGVSVSFSEVGDITTYEVYLNGCKRMLTDKTPREYYNWDIRKQNDYTDQLIVSYVRNNPKSIEGFMDSDNNLDMDKVINKLRIDIIDFGILREALEDDTVQEIQINDCKTIWVVRKGKSELFCDSNGKPHQFVNNEELHATIDRLVYNPNGTTPRMTKTNPLVNTRTSGKGYRVSAVNDSAITPDSRVGFDFPCTSVTIRKYAPSMLTFDDFEQFGSIAHEMSDFLRFCGKANIRLACVGPTSSGKTTLLNSVCWEVDPDLRLLLIQNPTEIMIYDRADEDSHNRRNVLHWEATDLTPEQAKDPTTPTMANLIAHTLRNTPDVIVPGEVRTPEEFYQMNRALKTGHRVLSTWHALNAQDAIDRAATELATLGGSATEYIRSLANSFDIIVTQQRLGDGTRKVMSIDYLTGKVIDGKAEAVPLFQYHLTGDSEKDENGKVTRIYGYFQQCNPISEELAQSFYSVGISKDELQKYLTCPPKIDGRSNLTSQVKFEEERIASLAAYKKKKGVVVEEKEPLEGTLSFLDE